VITMTDPESRLQRIEDRLAIGELIARYGILLDNREYAAVGELFTEDARFWQHVGDTDARTRTGIVEFYRDRLSHSGPSYHYPHAHVLTFESDDEATGVVAAHAEMGIEGRMVLVGLRYHDRYRKGADGAWRFAERETWFHYFLPADELPRRYSDEIRRTWPGAPLPADLPDSLPSYQAEPHAGFSRAAPTRDGA
jgi:ketosteroid isomerase-like protein